MGPNKGNAQKGPAQKHLHSRISYLYQAATYLAEASGREQARNSSPEIGDSARNKQSVRSATSNPPIDVDRTAVPSNTNGPVNDKADDYLVSKSPALTRRLLGHLRAVSLKGQIRLSPAMKHSICKRCDLLLVPGSSATLYIENRSRGGKRSWADVLVMTCTACGTARRFPVEAKRQPRRRERPAQTTLEPMHKAEET